MPELQTIPDLLGRAESAAAAGDLSSADELLRTIARIQEHELGSQHPDLANTLNNLAIVAEKTGRPDDAETFYRRAVAIASASLAPDDPMLAASRQNLEDFCRAQGIPSRNQRSPHRRRIERYRNRRHPLARTSLLMQRYPLPLPIARRSRLLQSRLQLPIIVRFRRSSPNRNRRRNHRGRRRLSRRWRSRLWCW